MAEPSNNAEDEVVTDTSISWPLNRQGNVYKASHSGLVPKMCHMQCWHVKHKITPILQASTLLAPQGPLVDFKFNQLIIFCALFPNNITLMCCERSFRIKLKPRYIPSLVMERIGLHRNVSLKGNTCNF